MKWYFACNNASSSFFPLIKAAVRSAIANTTLEPHFIYDGESDELTQWLEKKGVKVIYHRSLIYDVLKKNYSAGSLHIPAGAYLRCDIPVLEQEDEYVLYTDCDVVFLKDITEKDLPKPKYFACSSQFNKHNFRDYNTGVMVMNVPNLRASHNEFLEFIKNNIKKFPVFDQSAYQYFYGLKCTKLNIRYNHKPYWGVNDEAVILHYHGPKPVDFTTDEKLKNLNPYIYRIYKKNIEGYKYYLEVFKQYSDEIEYNYDAIELLNNDVYPQKKTLCRPLKTRMKNCISKIVLPYFYYLARLFNRIKR